MIEVPIFDSAFEGQEAANANGDNLGRAPAYFRWRHLQSMNQVQPGQLVWLTDSQVYQGDAARINERGAVAVAWLLEPRDLHPENYEYVEAHADDFELIVTHDAELLSLKAACFAPWGGTRVAPAEWQVYPKSRNVSIVASPKRGMEGHGLRHAAITALGHRADAFGPEYRPMERKLDSLVPYRYQVVFENCRRDFWFTEHLIDCFLTGTVPVYWGCPGISRHFEPAGIIEITSLADLMHAVPHLDEDDYRHRLRAVRDNFVLAHEYTLTEDWIARRHPELVGRVALARAALGQEARG